MITLIMCGGSNVCNKFNDQKYIVLAFNVIFQLIEIYISSSIFLRTCTYLWLNAVKWKWFTTLCPRILTIRSTFFASCVFKLKKFCSRGEALSKVMKYPDVTSFCQLHKCHTSCGCAAAFLTGVVSGIIYSGHVVVK